MRVMKCREFAVLAGAVSLLAVAGGGCYNYKSPSPTPMSDTYTQREKSERDDLFKDMKQLTRADAQRIALTHHPSWKRIDFLRDATPPAQVEIPHAEVRALNPDIRQNRMQPLFKLRFNVVEYL